MSHPLVALESSESCCGVSCTVWGGHCAQRTSYVPNLRQWSPRWEVCGCRAILLRPESAAALGRDGRDQYFP